MIINSKMSVKQIQDAFDFHDLGNLGVNESVVLQGLFARSKNIEIEGFGRNAATFVFLDGDEPIKY